MVRGILVQQEQLKPLPSLSSIVTPGPWPQAAQGTAASFTGAFTPIKNIFLLLRKRSVLLSCQRLWEMSYTFLFVVRLMMPAGYKEDHRKQILLANSLLGEIQAVVGCAARTIKKTDNLKGYSLYIILTLCR